MSDKQYTTINILEQAIMASVKEVLPSLITSKKATGHLVASREALRVQAQEEGMNSYPLFAARITGIQPDRNFNWQAQRIGMVHGNINDNDTAIVVYEFRKIVVDLAVDFLTDTILDMVEYVQNYSFNKSALPFQLVNEHNDVIFPNTLRMMDDNLSFDEKEFGDISGTADVFRVTSNYSLSTSIVRASLEQLISNANVNVSTVTTTEAEPIIQKASTFTVNIEKRRELFNV